MISACLGEPLENPHHKLSLGWAQQSFGSIASTPACPWYQHMEPKDFSPAWRLIFSLLGFELTLEQLLLSSCLILPFAKENVLCFLEFHMVTARETLSQDPSGLKSHPYLIWMGLDLGHVSWQWNKLKLLELQSVHGFIVVQFNYFFHFAIVWKEKHVVELTFWMLFLFPKLVIGNNIPSWMGNERGIPASHPVRKVCCVALQCVVLLRYTPVYCVTKIHTNVW